MIRTTLLFMCLTSTMTWAAPSVHNIESVKMSPSQVYITDEQSTTWILEPSCDYELQKDSDVTVKYGERKIRLGKRISITVDGDTQICRVHNVREVQPQ